jgi:hypothetical protein
MPKPGFSTESAKNSHPEAGTVTVVLQGRPKLEIPDNYQRFHPGTLLLAKLQVHPATAEHYRFLGWRLSTSESLLQPNGPDFGYQWNVASDCEVTAVFTHVA